MRDLPHASALVFAAALLLAADTSANPIPGNGYGAPDSVAYALQPANPADSVLVAYALALFPTDIRGDGVVSHTWSELASADSVLVRSPDQCFPGQCWFQGDGDAQVSVKAAANYRGLYLLVTVVDDHWADPGTSADSAGDTLVLFFDSYGADVIANCADCFIGPPFGQLTYCSVVMRIGMGSVWPARGCRLAYYDHSMWTWTEVGIAWDMLENNQGYQVEPVSISDTVRCVEIFFPWETYCCRVPVGTILNDLRLGFTVGYDDRDTGDEPPGVLRWLGRDPFSPGSHAVWGTLYPSPLPPLPALEVRQPAPRNRPELRYTIHVAQPVRISVFDLGGSLVRRLVDCTPQPGTYTQAWDGRDSRGRRAGEGWYVVRMETGGRLFTKTVRVRR